MFELTENKINLKVLKLIRLSQHILFPNRNTVLSWQRIKNDDFIFNTFTSRNPGSFFLIL